jgi:hypothetical protein
MSLCAYCIGSYVLPINLETKIAQMYRYLAVRASIKSRS